MAVWLMPGPGQSDPASDGASSPEKVKRALKALYIHTAHQANAVHSWSY